MKRRSPRELRILAIDPTSKGFGFAVLEGPDLLVDWGTRGARKDRNARVLVQVGAFLDRYRPDILLLEDTSSPACRRGDRAKGLIRDIRAAARSRRVKTRLIPRSRVRRAFSQVGPTTKAWIAGAIASRFPELEPRLPPRRKPWMPEDERMGIFDAVAFGWTYFHSVEKERPQDGETLA